MIEKVGAVFERNMSFIAQQKDRLKATMGIGKKADRRMAGRSIFEVIDGISA